MASSSSSRLRVARAVFAAYADRLRLIEPEGQIAPGLNALPLAGHTPGHGGWRLERNGAMLIHGGDIIHAPSLQAPDPDIAIAFDMDIDTARASAAQPATGCGNPPECAGSPQKACSARLTTSSALAKTAAPCVVIIPAT